MPELMELNYAGAANLALRRCMEERPEAILYGEDVAKPGGVFGVTRGLHKQFGDRVFDTPISESAILGSAVGAAIMGRRPIVEIMWIDFALVALDQIVNQAANVRYVSQGKLQAPITIRTQEGALPGSCAQHSQCLEAFFTHVPGLRVVAPATPQDAYDLLVAAVNCDDPTLVIESRGLYAGEKEMVTVGGPVQGIGKARVVREGHQATIVSWGAMLHRVLAAAQMLEDDGVSVEVVDARWLAPLDLSTVLKSVEKTARLAVVHEANVTGGFGAEIVARVVEQAFELLDAAPLRLGAADCRVPAAPNLQDALIPSADSIRAAVAELVAR